MRTRSLLQGLCEESARLSRLQGEGQRNDECVLVSRDEGFGGGFACVWCEEVMVVNYLSSFNCSFLR